MHIMQVIDLTEHYRKSFIKKGRREDYENSFPELFAHYYDFWTKREYDIETVSDDAIKTRVDWIEKHLLDLEAIFGRYRIAYSDVDLVCFVGVGTTNGHAFRHADKLYVWLPLESYTSEELVKIFVTHEFAHALHYQASPDFYFSTIDEKLNVSRQLITEGLATYMTAKLLNVLPVRALWADFLSKKDAENWWTQCRQYERALFQLINENYLSCKDEIEIFYANDKNNIMKYRAGYYAGLKLVNMYLHRNKLSINELIQLPRKKFEIDILELIQQLL